MNSLTNGETPPGPNVNCNTSTTKQRDVHCHSHKQYKYSCTFLSIIPLSLGHVAECFSWCIFALCEAAFSTSVCMFERKEEGLEYTMLHDATGYSVPIGLSLNLQDAQSSINFYITLPPTHPPQQLSLFLS